MITPAYAALGLYILVSVMGAAEGINPWRDRPRSYLIAALVMEVAFVWLALKVVV